MSPRAPRLSKERRGDVGVDGVATHSRCGGVKVGGEGGGQVGVWALHSVGFSWVVRDSGRFRRTGMDRAAEGRGQGTHPRLPLRQRGAKVHLLVHPLEHKLHVALAVDGQHALGAVDVARLGLQQRLHERVEHHVVDVALHRQPHRPHAGQVVLRNPPHKPAVSAAERGREGG